MKKLIVALTIIASLTLTCALHAQDATTKPAALRGKVTKVDGLVITITSKAGDATVTTDANTTFTLDGKPATLADVKEGERLSATPADGVATEVKLMSGKKKKKKAADGADAPASSPANN